MRSSCGGAIVTNGTVDHLGFGVRHGDVHVTIMVDGKLSVYAMPAVRFWAALSSAGDVVKSLARPAIYEAMDTAPVDVVDV